MIRSAQLLLRGAFAAVIVGLLPNLASAQGLLRITPYADVAVPPAPAGNTNPIVDLQTSEGEPDFLRTLPRPPEQPGSLFLPAPPPTPPPYDSDQSYFGYDPLLDPPQWAQPGWFCDAQVTPVLVQVSNQMQENVITGLGHTYNVNLGNAALGWTVAPRVELGYRLPSGLGEFSVSGTGLSTNGSQSISGPDGPAVRSSSLSFNYVDFDYHSREYTPFGNWEMKWRAGWRVTQSSISTSFNQPFAQAAGGSQVFAARQVNSTFGFGPHIALELERHIADTGFSFVSKIDLADNYTNIDQSFFVANTVNGFGHPDTGSLVDRFQNQVIILTAQLGLAWTPVNYRNTRVYLGYLDETWWQVLANESALSQGQFNYQGVVFRASWNY